MKTGFRKLRVESLEGRSVLSSMVEADFNNDGFQDVAAITGPNTITVSLFDPADGGYDVSATLKAPKSLPIGGLTVSDLNADGNLDISSGGIANNRFYSHNWLGRGDGTFDDLVTQKSSRIRPGW